MKNYIRLSCLLIVFLMSAILLIGCNSSTEESESDIASLYSDGIDNNGFWKGIKALNYVEDFDYLGMTIPAEVHNVSDEDLQQAIITLMSGYTSRIQITDREVANGDTVNVNYEGMIDGEAFEGSLAVGADIVVEEVDDNTQSFFNDFFEQLIGQMPGSTFDVRITFPEDYYVEDIQGKEAVFATTINYILEREALTDEFVAEKMSESNGWTTIEEMKEGVKTSLQKDTVQEYIEQFLKTEVSVKSVPDSMIKYREKILLNEYQGLAEYNRMELEEYLKEFEGFSSEEACLVAKKNDFVEEATYLLVIQAIAEDADISVSDEDMEQYSINHLWSSDISLQVEQYGLPHVKQVVLDQKVIDYIAENAKFL